MYTCLCKWIASWNLLSGFAEVVYGIYILAHGHQSYNGASIALGLAFLIFGAMVFASAVFLIRAFSEGRDSLLLTWFCLTTLKITTAAVFLIFVLVGYISSKPGDGIQSSVANLNWSGNLTINNTILFLLSLLDIARDVLLVYIMGFGLDILLTVLSIIVVFKYRAYILKLLPSTTDQSRRLQVAVLDQLKTVNEKEEPSQPLVRSSQLALNGTRASDAKVPDHVSGRQKGKKPRGHPVNMKKNHQTKLSGVMEAERLESLDLNQKIRRKDAKTPPPAYSDMSPIAAGACSAASPPAVEHLPVMKTLTDYSWDTTPHTKDGFFAPILLEYACS
ncbi:hypothetical protein BV898_08796 [Hypsibius exemplaris]|uniref:Uncharacterized protein n=1 Tax=Hypsibius exemplaris TaxID=2072580 RepID=A0A1W0WPE6_HYPEX|nr:hypothetical protein BV898_08796 [Hypsibius exemplaris]